MIVRPPYDFWLKTPGSSPGRRPGPAPRAFILVFAFIFVGLISSMHHWFRDLACDLAEKYETLLSSLLLGCF